MMCVPTIVAHIYFIRCVQGLHDSLPLQPYVSASSSGGDSHRPTDCQIARSHLPHTMSILTIVVHLFHTMRSSSPGGDSHRLQTFRLPECQIPRSHLNPIRCTFPRLWHTCFIRCVQGLHDSLPLQPYVSASNPGGDSH